MANVVRLDRRYYYEKIIRQLTVANAKLTTGWSSTSASSPSPLAGTTRAPDPPALGEPGSTDAQHRPGPAHRHDPAEDPMDDPPLARLLDLQHKLAELLEPGGLRELGSVGWRATAAQFVLDLRLLVGLLQASWPQARPLAEPWIPADAIDRHLDQQRRRAADAQQASRKQPDLVVYDRPPADPAACAGLLALADQILSQDDPLAAQQLLDPLIARVAARNPWVPHLLRAQAHCSGGLRAAITPQLRRLRPTSSSLGPPRAYRFGVQHVPQYLPVDWHDRHFHGLASLNPRLLRRLASIKLVQLTQGGSQLPCPPLGQ